MRRNPGSLVDVCADLVSASVVQIRTHDRSAKTPAGEVFSVWGHAACEVCEQLGVEFRGFRTLLFG